MGKQNKTQAPQKQLKLLVQHILAGKAKPKLRRRKLEHFSNPNQIHENLVLATAEHQQKEEKLVQIQNNNVPVDFNRPGRPHRGKLLHGGVRRVREGEGRGGESGKVGEELQRESERGKGKGRKRAEPVFQVEE